MELGTDICTQFDGYMTDLCHNKLVMSWIATLTDGTKVYGDYERPDTKNPWNRLASHCKTHNVVPCKVELYMFGAEHVVFFEDPKGLDGISIFRGVAREQSMDGHQTRSFQTLTVSLLDDSCDYINVAKYIWPHNDFEQRDGKRILSRENLKYMIFKNDSEKIKHPNVQKHINGTEL